MSALVTVNRGWIKRQIIAGKMEARCDHEFTDDYAFDAATNFGKTDWKPCRMETEGETWQTRPNGFITFSDYELRTKSGAAWRTEGEIITLNIHSNRSYSLRLIGKGEIPAQHETPSDPADASLIAECESFARRWHESERAAWDRNGYTAPGMDHDTYNAKKVKDRGKVWVAVDRGESGHFMVRKADGLVFHIKGYGVANLKKCIGHVSDAFQGDASGKESAR